MSPAYFFDQMTPLEMSEYLEGLEDRRREVWTQTRYIVHAVYQSQCSRKIKPCEVLSFPWDDDTPDRCGIDDTAAAREALAKRAEAMEEIIKNK